MANKKTSELVVSTEVTLEDFLTHLDKSDTTQGLGGSLKKLPIPVFVEFLRSVLNSAVENSYTNIAAMQADQANQTTGFFQYVADASADPTVTSGRMYYEYLGTTTGTLTTDYRKLENEEITLVQNNYRTFEVKDIVDTLPVNPGEGMVYLRKDVSDTIEAILFDGAFSRFLGKYKELYDTGTAIKVKMYNKTQQKTLISSVIDFTYSDITDIYFICDLSSGNTTDDVALGDMLEVYFDIDNTGATYFVGTYVSLAALTTAHPAPIEGAEAHINEVGAVQVMKAIWDNEDDEWVIVGAASSGGDLEYQAEITAASTVLSTQKGLNKVYPFNSASAQTAQVNNGVYVANDVVNFERRGEGTFEILQGTNVRFRGVRTIENRYFINDSNSLVSIACRGNVGGIDYFSIFGNLSKGFISAVTTSSYTPLRANETTDVTVTGEYFTANMLITLTGNATLNSLVYVSSTEIILNITSSGAENDNLTLIYDNGQVFTDTDCITLIADLANSLVIHTTSTSATWSPALVTKTGDTLTWTVTGGASGTYNANDPTINLSANSGTAIITVTSVDDLAGLTGLAIASLSITSLDVSGALDLTGLTASSNPFTSLNLTNNTLLTSVTLTSCTSMTSLDISGLSLLQTLTAGTASSLTSLVTGGNTSLKTVTLSSSGLSTLDLSSSSALDNVNLTSSSSLTTLNIGTSAFNTTTKSLQANACALTSINLQFATGLTTLRLSGNNLTSLDISQNVALTQLLMNNLDLTTSSLNNVIIDLAGFGNSGSSFDYSANLNNPTATESTANDVLNAYNTLVASWTTVTGTTPS